MSHKLALETFLKHTCLWQVISEDVGMTLEKEDLTSLGSAKKATISKDDTILLDGGGSKDQIEERNDQLRQMISKTTSDYDR